MDKKEDIFEIKVDFERGSGDPARVFRTMSGLIESIQSLDNHLAHSINVSIKSKLILEDIETGSLKAKLKTIIEDIPDEHVVKGEIKPIVGHFLHKAKHKIIDWCSDKKEIKNRLELKEIEGEVLILAEETNINRLPAYAPLDTETLLSDINSIQDSLSHLEAGDSANITSPEGASTFNSQLVVTKEAVRDILTKETLESTGMRILKVKKPDYLGFSKWSFKHLGHTIEASISDERWLSRFQNKLENVQPGDSLKAKVKEEVSYGYDGELVHAEYEVLEVLEVIPAVKVVQADLLSD